MSRPQPPEMCDKKNEIKWSSEGFEVFDFGLELPLNVNLKEYQFYRKTKGGTWEYIGSLKNPKTKHLASLYVYGLIEEELGRYFDSSFLPGIAVTTRGRRQIMTTFVSSLVCMLYNEMESGNNFGVSINKGETYIFCPCPSKKNYSNVYPYYRNYVAPLSRFLAPLSWKHNGMKTFKKARTEDEDDYFQWGWLIFNDGYKISLAIDVFYEKLLKYNKEFGSQWMVQNVQMVPKS